MNTDAAWQKYVEKTPYLTRRQRRRREFDAGYAAAQEWRQAAEVVLSGVTVQGIPALEFVDKVIRVGHQVAED